MPLQNRVLPDGSIVVDPSRGLLTGNRGILHDDAQTLRYRWTSKAWICCALAWKGTRRTPMTGRSWTELFFLDEAVALSSGHRPCANCRREAYNAFRAAWAKAGLPGSKAPEIDAKLHAARLTEARHQRLHEADARTLPDGSFILHPHRTASSEPLPEACAIRHQTPAAAFERMPQACAIWHPTLPHGTDASANTSANLFPAPHLILGQHLHPFTPSGYLAALPRPTGPVQVMTPAPLVAILRAGYGPILHPSAF